MLVVIYILRGFVIKICVIIKKLFVVLIFVMWCKTRFCIMAVCGETDGMSFESRPVVAEVALGCLMLPSLQEGEVGFGGALSVCSDNTYGIAGIIAVAVSSRVILFITLGGTMHEKGVIHLCGIGIRIIDILNILN